MLTLLESLTNVKFAEEDNEVKIFVEIIITIALWDI